MNRFTDQLAVVTGGGRGIGAAIAARLADEGAEVVVVDRDVDVALAVAQQVGGSALELDVTDPERVAVLLGPAGLGGRSVSVLVNNAGYDHFGLLAVNLEGVLACTQAVLPGMQKAGYGRIVTVSSEAGRIGSKGNAVYAASKAGVIGFMKSIARENARYAITANCVAAGPVETPLLDQIRELGELGEKMIAAMEAGTQLGRLATPAEIAAGVAFLAAPEASYVTGETLGVSGGMGLGG